MNFIGPYSDWPLLDWPRYRSDKPIHIRKIATTRGMPLPVPDVMADLRIDSQDEVLTVERMIRGAAAFLERRTGIAFLAGRYEAHFDGFHSCPWRFQRYPLRSVTAVEYLDVAMSPPSWVDAGLAHFHAVPEQASFDLIPLRSFSSPIVGAPLNGVRVRFDAGFDPVYQSGSSDGGDAVSEHDEDEPQPIEDDARLLLTAAVGHFYENRELFAADKIADIEASAGSLFTSRRKFW